MCAHYWEDVCIPRNEFIREHVKLLKLLKHGNRAQLLAEAKSQEAELKGKTGMEGGILVHLPDDSMRGRKMFLDWVNDKWRVIVTNQQINRGRLFKSFFTYVFPFTDGGDLVMTHAIIYIMT
jgi:hypothetical protein